MSIEDTAQPQPQPQPQAPLPSAADSRPKTDWWAEAKGVFWLVLAVLAFHSFLAKPFYIPSESMMPTLIKGDRLVVTKYPYGWSYVSPSITRIPGAPGRWLGRLTGQDYLSIPFIHGRLFGHLPQRGDVVIAKPPTQYTDYIKRVIGLPGDRIELRNGVVILNGVPVKRQFLSPAMIPIDPNIPCDTPDVYRLRVTGPDGREYCQMPRVRETLPNGVSYDTIDLGPGGQNDDYPALTIPEGHVFLMGDNRDQSADSRVSSMEGGLGGPVPVENLGGRAEFITFSLDGTSTLWNPISWFTAMRGGRAGTSLRPAHAEAPAQ
ncbi:signal peptidase I [Sphingomonas sp. MM-1]|uniref:signal peptidase I n=1 Tax=Sphingomonas sp. MM-1 TaxID=745310 RepID=UPI0002C06554|nr:signal peptidase I [Sphingomonas sp. MM-1]AGH50564.1 signal peptidase I [Sphingomonas sp. MM-1]